ncbi:splicing regulator SDE2 [Wyeomyia smithii]|uniref:splicing regulator SDE2 n=1 Tax=Wyeomyia smithii TaxID=174621 RepID=UPI002467C90D|nr:splicing regulator SDE2 [Wyeomyia smithii]
MIEVILGKHIYRLEAAELLSEDFYQWIESKTGLPPSDYFLTQNGKCLPEKQSFANLQHAIPIRLHERLQGGKGGFGSMLRAIGAQIEKTTNREACRDLSGRRLRDINEEKRLKAYLDKQKDAPADEAAKLQKKIDKLLAKPKHEFHDEEYNRVRSDLTQNVDEAVQEGFRKALEAERAAESAGGVKRKNATTDNGKGGKKKKQQAKGSLWLGADDLGSSSSSSSDSESEDSGGSDSVGSPSGATAPMAVPDDRNETGEKLTEQQEKQAVTSS